MKFLKDILFRVALEAVRGELDIEIQSIAFDSRAVDSAGVFVAFKGELFDGHRFIDQAIAAGAHAIVCEEFPSQLQPKLPMCG